MHAGTWDKSAVSSHEVGGCRLGTVGYRNIGSQVSVLAETLCRSVLLYDTSDRLALGNAQPVTGRRAAAELAGGCAAKSPSRARRVVAGRAPD